MTADLTPFDSVDDSDGSFESFGHENGDRYWWQSDLRRMLGYGEGDSFNKAVGRAIAAC
jgi:hypothetical protein